MSVDVDFRWESEPAILMLAFGPASPRIDVAAIVAPVLARSFIQASLAGQLVSLGLASPVGRSRLLASVSVQRTAVPDFILERRALPLPVRLEPRGSRASVVLGLDFLSRFGIATLSFDGPLASLSLGR